MRKSAAPSMLLLLLLSSCEGGGPGRAAGSGAAPLRQEAREGARLAPRGEWSLLNPGGPFLVSPAWIPGAPVVIAAGKRGIGLFSIDAEARAVRAVDPSARGALHRTATPGALCLLAGGRIALVEPAPLPDGARLRGADAAACGISATASGTTGLVLFAGGGRTIVHDLYTGDVLVRTGGGEKAIQEGDAWGVAVSPGGGKVAWCLGHLTDPILMIHDVATGTQVVVGRGAHPAWLPDGGAVVYDVPAAGATGGIVEADLFRFAWGDAQGTLLADTPGVAEMQPAVSPDGARVVFSDWRTGDLWAAPLLRGEGGGR